MPEGQYQLFMKGLNGNTTTIRIKKDATIKELRETVSEKTGIPDEEIRLLYCSKDLRSKDAHGKIQTLEDYKIHDEANLCLVLRLKGGSDNGEQPKLYDAEVELTNLPDMFTLDDEEDGQRAKMPCGHAVGPESLTAYCRSLLTAGKYEFRCPYKKSGDQPFCDSMWEFFTVKRLAVLTASELKEFEIKIAENYLRKAVGIQDCPRCTSYCERIDKTDIRVVCPVCTRAGKRRYEFCWYCLRTWLSSGTTVCGNANCAGVDPRMKIVMECPKKTVVGVPNCPAVRACPTCGLLIEHKSACKQMTCPCGQKFCFICLKKASAIGRYSCGAWNFKCEVAPIQTTLPGN